MNNDVYYNMLIGRISNSKINKPVVIDTDFQEEILIKTRNKKVCDYKTKFTFLSL